MIEIIKGDLFTTDCKVIAHQVNCTGTMGSGVAKIVKEKFPEVYKIYHNQCIGRYNGVKCDPWLMGSVSILPRDDGNGYIANIFSQYFYRGFFIPDFKDELHRDRQYLMSDMYPPVKTKNLEGRYTDYEAFYSSLTQIKFFMKNKEITSIAFPYNIGCDRGGGNWNIIRTMIEEVLKDMSVKLYKL